MEKDPNGLDANVPGAKLDHGKTKWSLLPLEVVEGVAKVMTFGANKYTADGWKSVDDGINRYYSAMTRHWAQVMIRGEYLDPESGLPHWAHFCCNAIFIGYFMLKGDKNAK